MNLVGLSPERGRGTRTSGPGEGVRYRLSFCTITEVEDGIFEVVVDEGTEVGAAQAEEENTFWQQRTAPYAVLLNCKTSFSYTYGGASTIGANPLQRKIAVVAQKRSDAETSNLAISFSKMNMPAKIARVFSDYDVALAWLREPVED